MKMDNQTGNRDERVYTTAISKGAAMLDETKRLLLHWRPDETLDNFAKRVHEEGLLGKATAYRTRDVVTRVFAPRFLRPNNRPALILKALTESDLPVRTFNEMVFLFAARQDPLIYDFTVEVYWPAVRRGRSVLDTDQALSFLTEAALDGRVINVWSESVSIRIARCTVGMLRDIGFLRERGRGHREIVDYRMSDEGVAILARELTENGVTDSTLSEHSDWTLFGMNQYDVLARLSNLGEHRGLIVQQAGTVVSLTWRVNSMEELINVLSGKLV